MLYIYCVAALLFIHCLHSKNKIFIDYFSTVMNRQNCMKHHDVNVLMISDVVNGRKSIKKKFRFLLSALVQGHAKYLFSHENSSIAGIQIMAFSFQFLVVRSLMFNVFFAYFIFSCRRVYVNQSVVVSPRIDEKKIIFERKSSRKKDLLSTYSGLLTWKIFLKIISLKGFASISLCVDIQIKPNNYKRTKSNFFVLLSLINSIHFILSFHFHRHFLFNCYCEQ